MHGQIYHRSPKVGRNLDLTERFTYTKSDSYSFFPKRSFTVCAVSLSKKTIEVKDTAQKVKPQWRVVHLYLWT